MNVYRQFHGDIPINEIGRELRRLVMLEKENFKILTGYGSSKGTSHSKSAALKALEKMKHEGMINGYLPGEVKQQLLTDKSPFYESKMQYDTLVKSDTDYGNDGIIYIFVSKSSRGVKK
jgi:hypothetical protein